MSTINSKNVQVGTSGTAAQNFTLYQPATPDGTVRLGVGNSGATTADVVTVNSSGVTVTGSVAATTGTFSGAVQASGVATNLYPLVSGTSVASTSGTSIDFTSIPSWVKRITVMFNVVSTSGTSNYLVQVGNSTPTTSGYVSVSTYATTSGTVGGTSSTAGMVLFAGTATNQIFGSFTLVNVSGNIWVGTGVTADTVAATFVITSSGRVSLASALNLVRVTTVNGTDTFDAGSINIIWE